MNFHKLHPLKTTKIVLQILCRTGLAMHDAHGDVERVNQLDCPLGLVVKYLAAVHAVRRAKRRARYDKRRKHY